MNLREIAKVGLKGRKKDTILLKIVITLAFIFIITSTIFQGSIETTKSEQGLDLYGEWHAAYMHGDNQVRDRLKEEKDIDKMGVSTIIGQSQTAGVVGTFNDDLVDMGRFKLYKGRYPEKADEIMVELNQMSDMGLELEVGQKIEIELNVLEKHWDLTEYIRSLGENLDRQQVEEEVREGHDPSFPYFSFSLLKTNGHHTVPFQQVGDVLVVASKDYTHVSPQYSYVSPEMIINEGALTYHNLVLKKKFTITGIVNTYSDKWDSEGFISTNAFITEESGQEFINAIYNNDLGDFSHHHMKHNMYLYSSSLKEDLYSNLKDKYPDLIVEDVGMDQTWLVDQFIYEVFRKSEEELAEFYENINIVRLPYVEAHNEGNIEDIGQDDTKMEINTSNFRKNNFSYPDGSDSTEKVLSLTIIAIIFVATALAIFQIFLTQMRRRSRKIVLLKSIGATNGQIVKIIAYEGLYLLKTGILVGLPTGLVSSAIIVYGMNLLAGRNIDFHIVPSLFILGIVAGILALFIGMAVPVLYAVRIPLVGTMSKPPKHKISSEKTNIDISKRQTFNSINLKYYKQNRGKTFISFGLSLISIIILTTTILLSYISFDNYKDVVLSNNRPDYAMETFYGESTVRIPRIKDDLFNIEGIEKADVYKVGKSTILWYEGIEENRLINHFEKGLPQSFLPRHFLKYNDDLKDQEPWIKDGFYTKYYGIDPEGDIFERYNSQITLGSINKKSFTEGKEVILLIPMYLEGDTNIDDIVVQGDRLGASTTDDNRMSWLFKSSDAYNLSYSGRYADYYMKPDEIRPGDTIFLSADEEKIEGESRVISFVTKEVKVGGIIHYFPDQGEWPFSNTISPYVVMGSYDGMESVFTSSLWGLSRRSLQEMKNMTDSLFPNKYGRTVWYLETDSNLENNILDAKLLTYANENGYTLYNYKASNVELYNEALNNAIIIALLGITAAAIACVILYNTTVSKLEQDKNRIGILQALGVTKEQFSKQYLKLGIVTGLSCLIITHIVLFIILLITSIGLTEGINLSFGDYIYDIFVNRLWLYPWFVHIIICILYLVVTIMIYYLPNKKVTNLYPVENIRSLGR